MEEKFYPAADGKDVANLSLPNQGSFSFTKKIRLLLAHQFRKVMQYGYTIAGTYLSIQICENKSSLKLGITVSRKYGTATKRNRFKRLVREAFRLSQHQLPNHLHLNVRPQIGVEASSLHVIQKELLALCTHRYIS